MAEPPAEQPPPLLTGVAGALTPREAVDTVAQLDDQQSQAPVAALNGHAGPAPVSAWRELMSGRFVVFLRQGDQTYCLMPLAFSRPAGVP